MGRRVKRKLAAADTDRMAEAQGAASPQCVLCDRPVGTRVEWHHLVPKSEGGRVTAPVHPICHRTIHATLTNAQLARDHADADRLRAHPTLARFVTWIADKPYDFHAPVRRHEKGRRSP